MVPRPADLSLVNGTRDRLAVSVRVSQRPLFCSAIGPDDAPAVIATLFFQGDGGSVPERYARATWSGDLEEFKSWDYETGARCSAVRIWIGDEYEGHDVIAHANTTLTIVPGPEPGTYAIQGADEVQPALPQFCPTTMQDHALAALAALVSRPALSLGEPTGPACKLGDALVRPAVLQTSAAVATAVAPGTKVRSHPACHGCPGEYELLSGVRVLVPASLSVSPPRSDNDERQFFEAALVQRNDKAAP
ncbi:hypothetical protein [Nannocystis bainbridge]|uniref:Uncharacterized protein n=1 Tax=Nannocystis bainbridge TaxID=2995303 RepID=A0ABT5E6B0_9BACT|nr:hypothetical protein [Nannocystis bainbridge]MDC0720301.1 hypothetical protein [Nannocystis bainbridge]